MDKILNDNYDDKYTRATVVYAQDTETENTYAATYDEDGDQPVNSADLYELARKGLSIRLSADTEYFPTGVVKGTGPLPTAVWFIAANGSQKVLMPGDSHATAPIMEEPEIG